MGKKFQFAGIEIDNITVQTAIDEIESLIKKGESYYIVTPNAAHIVLLQKDEEFKKIYECAYLVLADGMPVIWSSKLHNNPIKEKISGSDLLPKLCERAVERGYKLFFLGGRPGAALKTAEKLKKQYPAVSIEGAYSPPFGFENDADENRKIIKMIKDAGPDILFVGLGTPKQEKWIYKNKEAYRAPVSIGVGAAFDFTSGFVKRAPLWVQKSGLEWFHRLVLEPRRLWKRYLIGNAVFMRLIFKEWIKRVGRRSEY